MDNAGLVDGFYRIRFNSNDGRDLIHVVSLKYGCPTALPLVKDGLGWDRDGYVFVGWSVARQGRIAYRDGAQACKATGPGKILDVYAIWNPDDLSYSPFVNYPYISQFWKEPVMKVAGIKRFGGSVKELGLGSSHAHYGYFAGEEEYNLGDVSCDAYYSYEILKYWATRLPKLARVVYFYDIFTPGSIIDRSSESFRRICWLYFYGMHPQVADVRQDTGLGEPYSDCETVFHRCVSMHGTALPDGYRGNAIKRVPMANVDIAKRVAMHHRLSVGECDGHVRDMVDLCRNRGIDITVVVPPLRSDYIRELPPGFKVNPPSGARVIDYMGDFRFSDCDFTDCDHLNEAGAKKLTDLLHREIGAARNRKDKTWHGMRKKIR